MISAQRILTTLSVLSLMSCVPARAGIFDVIFGNGIGLPVPSLPGGVRMGSTPGQPMMPQTPRLVAAQLYNDGLQLAHNNQIQEARLKFEQAVKTDPSFDLAWDILISSCMLSGQLEEGIAVGQQFLQQFPHSSHRAHVTIVIAKLNEELAHKNEVWQKLGPDGADSYYALACDGQEARGWDLSKMPLKVFITDGHGVKGYRPEFLNILLSSFGEWTRATESHVRFNKVDSPAGADIEVSWIDDPKEFPVNKGMEAGVAMPQYNQDGIIVHANIIVLAKNRYSGKPETDLVVHGICLHEIGHALGLLGHSDNPDDALYFSESWQKVQDPHLSQRDVNTLARVYASLASRQSGQIIARQVDYHAAAQVPPAAAQSTGQPQPYNGGRTFSTSTQAISYFEQAVKSSPRDLSLLDDLGTAYSNYAIELAAGNDLVRAEQYFNLALAIQRNSRDQNKLLSTLNNLTLLLRFEHRDSEAMQLQQSCQSLLVHARQAI